MGRSPDAIVVGAGIVGAACALELARAGLRVRVLERAFPAAEATAAGMGHLVVMDDSEAQFALTAYSRGLWAELAPELPADCEHDACGTLWLAEDDEQLETARSKERFYGTRGVEAEVLDSGTLARAEPQLRAGLAGALRVPGDRVVYPPSAARFLLARAIDLGAECRVAREVDSIGAGHVVCAGERLDAGLVVNAAGAHAARLTPGLPVAPRRGHLVITERAPGFCRHQLAELGYLRSAHTLDATSIAFNVQPRATGQVLVGSSREFVGFDPRPDPSVRARMLRRAVEFLPGLARLAALRTWVGFRPATPDKLPLIGRHEPVAGVWLAAGHEGLGIATALGTGRLLADLIMGRAPAIDPSPYAPARFGGSAESAALPEPAHPRRPVPPARRDSTVVAQPESEAPGAGSLWIGPPADGTRPGSRFAIVVDGRAVDVQAGATIAAALWNAGVRRLRTSLNGAPRGALCAMGVCFECRVTIDGRPHRRACLEPCRPGLRVETGPGLPAEPA